MPKQTSLGYPYGVDFNPRGDRRSTDYIVTHHSATRNSDPLPIAETVVNYHMTPKPRGRGYHSGAYNALIERDGTIVWLLSRNAKGAHIGRLNSRAFGVCLAGGIDDQGNAEDRFTSAQKAAWLDLARQCRRDWPKAKHCGHNDLSAQAGLGPTACPAMDVAAWASEIDTGSQKVLRSESVTIDVPHPGPVTVTVTIEMEG